MSPQTILRRLISFDETPLFYRLQQAKEASRGAVLIIHGMGEHGGRYEHVAGYLSALGYVCLTPDLRGFGQSGGARGSVNRFSDYWRDLEVFHRYLLTENKSLPVFILGHSFGGLIASSYAALHKGPRVQGLILSSPLFGVAVKVPLWRKMLASAASRIAPDFSQATHLDVTKLTHDIAILQKDAHDSALHYQISARYYTEMNRIIALKRRIAENLKVPTLILQAAEDHIVDKKESRRFCDLLKADDKEYEEIPDAYHEILNELNREKTLYRIAQWLSKHS